VTANDREQFWFYRKMFRSGLQPVVPASVLVEVWL